MRSRKLSLLIPYFLIVVVIPLLLSPAAFGQAAPSAVPCDCSAYIVDPDPEGLNVRGGPGTTYPIVGILPTNHLIEIRITGANGVWMQISGAYVFVDDAPTGDVGMELSGWVYGPLLAVTTRPSGRMLIPLYSEPDATSKVVVELPMETEVTLGGCKGGWVKVRYGNIEGWLDPDSHCGNPVTTCP